MINRFKIQFTFNSELICEFSRSIGSSTTINRIRVIHLCIGYGCQFVHCSIIVFGFFMCLKWLHKVICLSAQWSFERMLVQWINKLREFNRVCLWKESTKFCFRVDLIFGCLGESQCFTLHLGKTLYFYLRDKDQLHHLRIFLFFVLLCEKLSCNSFALIWKLCAYWKL